MSIRIYTTLCMTGFSWSSIAVQAAGPPEPLGVCCLDVSDGPIPYETCEDTEASTCDAQGGLPGEPYSSCAVNEPCCLGFGGESFCVELAPYCCAISGGVAAGPDVTCADLEAADGCGNFCGGIASLPCEPGAFCRLGVGTCCCDFFGVCITLPDACPAVIEPVCGCDGITYLNACEANAAGMSLDHLGPCTPSHGDFDGDGNVDTDDFGWFAQCMSPPGSPPDLPNAITAQHCLDVFDVEGDQDVDLVDFAYLQSVMTR